MSFPYLSINDMLIQNKCWLCEQSFQRGKVKKVFQLTDLLEYYLSRMKTEGTDGSSSVDLKCRNMRECYDSFKSLVVIDESGNVNTEGILTELRRNDLETWMSGMVCGQSIECQEDLNHFIKNFDPTKANKKGSSASFLPTMGGKDCPPGCNCDNPWPFLS